MGGGVKKLGYLSHLKCAVGSVGLISFFKGPFHIWNRLEVITGASHRHCRKSATGGTVLADKLYPDLRFWKWGWGKGYGFRRKQRTRLSQERTVEEV